MKVFSKWTVFGISSLWLLAGFWGLKWVYAVAQVSPVPGNPLFAPQMNATRDAKTAFVMGDLGGVAVRIPRYWLAHWQHIQRNVTALVWRFKVRQATSPSVPVSSPPDTQ